MARHKDTAWNLNAGTIDADGVRRVPWNDLQAALLMDSRDELKRLDDLLHCRNFLAIPSKLERIARQTAKPRKKKK